MPIGVGSQRGVALLSANKGDMVERARDKWVWQHGDWHAKFVEGPIGLVG
jgi:hypothetical protein